MPTVYFNYNNATGGNTVASKEVDYKGEYGELPTPTRSYRVTFNKNGGTLTGSSAKTVTYTFDGWYNAESGGTKEDSTTIMNVKGGNLYARWIAPTYGTLPTCTKNSSGTTVYSFMGWFTAVSGGSKVLSSTVVDITSNQTLYAQWNTGDIGAVVTINVTRGLLKSGFTGVVSINGESTALNEATEYCCTQTLMKGDTINVGVNARYFGRFQVDGTSVSSTGNRSLTFTVPKDYGGTTGTLNIVIPNPSSNSDSITVRITRGGACSSFEYN